MCSSDLPDVPGVKDAWRKLRLLERIGVEKDRIHLIMNRWDKRDAPFTLADVERNLGRKVDATVAFDRSAAKSVNDGKLLRDVDRRAAAAKDLEALVGLVTDGEIAAEKKAGGPMSWFSRFSGG